MTREEFLKRMKISASFEVRGLGLFLYWRNCPLIQLEPSSQLLWINRAKPREMPEVMWARFTKALSQHLFAEYVKMSDDRSWFQWRWTGKTRCINGMLDHVLKGEDGYRFPYHPDPRDMRDDLIYKGRYALHLIWVDPLTSDNFDRLRDLKIQAENARRAVLRHSRLFWYIEGGLKLTSGYMKTKKLSSSEWDHSLIVTLYWKGKSYQLTAIPLRRSVILETTCYDHMPIVNRWQKHPKLLLETYSAFLKALESLPEELRLAAALAESK